MLFKCADCDMTQEFKGRTMRLAFELARQAHWGINKDNNVQWCPKHAPFHRNVGKSGKPKNIQIKLDV